MDVVWIKCEKCSSKAEAGFSRQYCTKKGCENYDEDAAKKLVTPVPERFRDEEEDTLPLGEHPQGDTSGLHPQGDNQDWFTWSRSACLGEDLTEEVLVERVIDPPSKL